MSPKRLLNLSPLLAKKADSWGGNCKGLIKAEVLGLCLGWSDNTLGQKKQINSNAPVIIKSALVKRIKRNPAPGRTRGLPGEEKAEFFRNRAKSGQTFGQPEKEGVLTIDFKNVAETGSIGKGEGHLPSCMTSDTMASSFVKKG